MRMHKRKQKEQVNLSPGVQLKPQQRSVVDAEKPIIQFSNSIDLLAKGRSFGEIDIFPPDQITTSKEILPAANLTMSNPQDKEEIQADQISNIAFNNLKNPQPQQVQAEQRDDDEVQGKFNLNARASWLQRDVEQEQQPEANASKGGSVSPQLEQDLQKVVQTGGTPINSEIQAAMSKVTGNKYDGVKEYDNSLSHDICARANAKALNYGGNNILYGKNQRKPHTDEGKKLAFHEMAHADQKGVTTTGEKSGYQPQNIERKSNLNLIQREFDPATVNNNAHLRNKDSWKRKIGERIDSESVILVDFEANHEIKQKPRRQNSALWRPAVNVQNPFNQAQVDPNKQGYIRSSSVAARGEKLENILKGRIKQILAAAEAKYDSLADHLVKDENIDFLFRKVIEYDSWKNKSLDGFVENFCRKEAKFDRIEAGANYVADSLEFWRKKLHSERQQDVTIERVKLVQSDLHERGLGVLQVKFIKPRGPQGGKFADDTNVEVFIKPEDKSLEENLLGDKANSVANRLNQILGLDANEALTTIKMICDAQHGSLVEKVRGIEAGKIPENAQKPILPAFNETIVFAFLAGIDDLHHENVFWHQGKPYLVDADNVLAHNQMINKDNGATPQSGFGSAYNMDEAQKNKEAIQKVIENQNNNANTVNSKILRAMIENRGQAIQIIDLLQGAVAGKKGRVVPIATSRWRWIINFYAKVGDREDWLNTHSSRDYLVRDGKPFNPRDKIGCGLIGNVYKNTHNDFYDQAAEKEELRKDFNANVIPFYEYDYDTGYVTHNGTKIYHGQTAEQAFENLLASFGHQRD